MPEVIRTLAGWRSYAEGRRRKGERLGLTMTMGALHAGHESLLERSRAQCDASLATIFVNPLQFDRVEDLERYEVDLEADLDVCDRHGVDAVLAPSTHEVWPLWPEATPTAVRVRGLTEAFEGADRPGHFDGVATVVTKLLVATGECTAYFGEKDFQQLCVVRRLVLDLSLPAAVVACPTVREDDGLACSSRNARLAPEARKRATVLHRALLAGAGAVESGDVGSAERVMREVAATEPEMHLAYAAVVEPATLHEVRDASPGTELRLLVAGVLEGVRLLDNAAAVVGAR